MFYETWNLGFDPVRESTPVTFQMELHFDADMLFFAKHYFTNRSYLRIHGRPVVFLYLTRTLTGNVAAMIQGARTVLEAHGYDPFFIGDEVYWRVTPEALNPERPGAHDDAAGRSYRAVRRRHVLHDVLRRPRAHLRAHRRLHRAIRARRTSWPTRSGCSRSTGPRPGDECPVIPDVGPGFNDRGFRLATNHPAQPRQWSAGRGSRVDPRPPVPRGGHPRAGSGAAHGDGDVMERLERGHRHRADRRDPDPRRRQQSRAPCTPQGYTYGGEGQSAVDTLRRDVALLDRAAADPAQPVSL